VSRDAVPDAYTMHVQARAIVLLAIARALDTDVALLVAHERTAKGRATALRDERNRPGSAKRARELGKDRQVGVHRPHDTTGTEQ
jgi:hypothetical protein